MLVWINGRMVPEEEALVSVMDRCFLYGDGLFETVRVYQGGFFRLAEHFARLERGAAFLKIALPFSFHDLRRGAVDLVERNGQPEVILRVHLSRGIGKRGYSPAGADHPILIMSLHPIPGDRQGNTPLWHLRTSPWPLPSSDPAAAFKTCSKLPHVIARADAEAHGANDALFLTDRGHVAETTCGNLFWIDGETICTPPLDIGILPGVTRAAVIEICRALPVPCREVAADLQTIRKADAVFLTLTSREFVEVTRINDEAIPRSPYLQRLRDAFRELVV